MYSTGLDRKIDEIGAIEVIPTLCAWSDLLGFSNCFAEKNWNLSEEDWVKVAKRLREMQIICQRNMCSSWEDSLVSNDAIIRNLDISKIASLTEISMWMRSLLYYYAGVNAHEKKQGLPGLRLVLAAGERVIHNQEVITREDYVLNYTKPDPDGVSNLTRQYGDKVVMYNHKFMQMNTAFSKSYIIDSIGSNGGISGNRFFIDISVVDFLKKFAIEHGIKESAIIDEEVNGKRRFIVLNGDSGYCYLGLVLKEPVKVRNLSTTVYVWDKFYPWDEKMGDFCFDVEGLELPVCVEASVVPTR